MKSSTPTISPSHSVNAAPHGGSAGTLSGAMPWTWSLGEPLEFLRLLWAVAHALHSTSKRLEVTMGITGPQRLALQMVGRFPQITAGQLAQLLHVDPSTLTGIVQRLVRRGLIQRRPDAHDGRRTLLGLTAEGRRFETTNRKTGGKAGKAGSTETAEAAVARALTGLRPAEIAAARRTLTALSAALSDGPGEGKPASRSAPTARARGAGKGAPASKPARTTAKKTTRPRRIAVAARAGGSTTLFAPRATRARVVLGSYSRGEVPDR
jgi:DNA-binding MarR family transcriptional regulator